MGLPQLGYVAFMVLAFVGFVLARRLVSAREPSRLTGMERFTLALAAFVGGSLSAKLPFALESPDGFWTLSTWAADGKTVTTGLIGAYLSVEIAKMVLGIRVKTGDGLAIPLAIALSIGRWGCFVNGCCAGKETSLPWCVDFGDGACRHPTQVYESIFHAIMALVLIFIARRGLLRYQRLKLYLIAYCVYRFAIEFIRIEPTWWNGLTYYQVAVVVFAVFLAAQWIYDAKKLKATDYNLRGFTS